MEDNTSEIRQRTVPKLQVTRSVSEPDEKKNSAYQKIDEKALSPTEHRTKNEVKSREFEMNTEFVD